MKVRDILDIFIFYLNFYKNFVRERVFIYWIDVKSEDWRDSLICLEIYKLCVLLGCGIRFV